ncbi:MAG: YihY/virulence factor BrkB family protein [Flavobacteriales bacterium AspAUS03]
MDFYLKNKNTSVKGIFFSLRQMKIQTFGGVSIDKFLKLYFLRLLRADLSTRASAASYSLFMSFFPFILFFFSVITRFPYNQGIISYLHNWIVQLFPPDTGQPAWEMIAEITLKMKWDLLSWSFIFSLIFSTNGIYALIERFDQDKRPFLKCYVISFLLTVFLTVLLLLTLLLMYYSQVVWRFFIDMHVPRFVLNLISYLGIWLAFFVGTVLLYSFGSKTHLRCKDEIPGALLTTGLFILASFLFGVYIRNFSNYNLLYGSIGTVLILMLWLYVNNILILAGYELNKTIAQIKKLKSTTKN